MNGWQGQLGGRHNRMAALMNEHMLTDGSISCVKCTGTTEEPMYMSVFLEVLVVDVASKFTPFSRNNVVLDIGRGHRSEVTLVTNLRL